MLEGFSALAALTSNVDPDAETILEFDLSEESIILAVYQTLDEDSIQIMAKDLKQSILIIVTWNLSTNAEQSMFQFKINEGDHHLPLEKFLLFGI